LTSSHTLFLASCLSLPPLFFFNAPATTEIYTLSLHDALPIFAADEFLKPILDSLFANVVDPIAADPLNGLIKILPRLAYVVDGEDRKSTRLNSSHVSISYAVFCLKKKKKYTSMNRHYV